MLRFFQNYFSSLNITSHILFNECLISVKHKKKAEQYITSTKLFFRQSSVNGVRMIVASTLQYVFNDDILFKVPQGDASRTETSQGLLS